MKENKIDKKRKDQNTAKGRTFKLIYKFVPWTISSTTHIQKEFVQSISVVMEMSNGRFQPRIVRVPVIVHVSFVYLKSENAQKVRKLRGWEDDTMVETAR